MPRGIGKSRRELLAAGVAAAALGATSCRAVPAPLTENLSGAGEREYLFEEGLTYFNTAAMGPTPRRVVEEMLRVWIEMERNPALHGYGRLGTAMDDVRASAARLLGCDLDEMILTSSTTEGMNHLAQSLDLKAGDRVLTTNQEHEGGMAGWRHLERRYGIGIDRVPLRPGDDDPQSIVEQFARAMTTETRVLSVSHVLYPTGVQLPIAALTELAEANGALCVVDGAQAVGAIHVDLRALGCHAYATCGHKWMQGPKGIGLLYIAARVASRIEPMAVEGGRKAYSKSTGVRNVPGVLGLGEAIRAIEAQGMQALSARALALKNRLDSGLRTIPRLTVISPAWSDRSTPIATFALPDDVDNRIFSRMLLEKHGVMMKPMPEQLPPPLPQCVRASIHHFNSEQEVDHVLSVLRAELG